MSPRNDPPKVYVLDTSVLIHDPNVIDSLADNTIVVPIWVIEELDRNKHKLVNAREASRIIDGYRRKCRANESLHTGVKTAAGGILIVDYDGNDWSALPPMLEQNNDNRILLIAIRWQDKKSKGGRVIVLSADTNLRIKANACGLEAQEYERERKVSTLSELWSGQRVIALPPEKASLIGDLPRNNQIPADPYLELIQPLPLPNECFLFSHNGKYQLAIFKAGSNTFRLVQKFNKQSPVPGQCVWPINNEQAFAFALLLDPSIELVTLVGRAGTGKTLISLLAADIQLNQGRFNQVLIYRPNIELGRELGFLPGDITEKFAPWAYPIIDNLELLRVNVHDRNSSQEDSAHEVVRRLMEGGYYVIEPINFIRGRSLNNRIVLVDEAQNLSLHEVRTIITRAGAGCKMILVGDPTQIDSPWLTSTNNGLVAAVESFRGQENFGHITLQKGERSRLSDQAAMLM